MKVLFIVNPRSGAREQDDLSTLINDEADRKAFEYSIFQMPSTDAAKKIRAEIESYKPDIVAAAGGDGTVSLMAKILDGSPAALLIIPFGSANGMAKELGIGNNVELAVSLISRGIVRKIDLLDVNGCSCIHLADVGLNARVVKRFENDSKRGVLTYAKHLMGEIFLIKQYRLSITYDDHRIQRKAVSVTFANASKYGTGAVINPTGKLDDGKFELVIVKPFPRIKLMSIAWKMFTGTLQTSEYVEVIKCSSATVRSSRRTTLQVDGEVLGRVKEINISMKKQVLNVLVPAQAK